MRDFLSQMQSLFFLPQDGARSADKADKPVTVPEVKGLYDRPRSFTDLLPYMEYNKEQKVFLLEDGMSVAALFDIQPISVEARPEKIMRELRNNVENVFFSLPQDDTSPWVMQWYGNNDPSLDEVATYVASYATPHAKETDYTKEYMQEFARHLHAISRPGGLFKDSTVTGTAFRGQLRRIRAVIYHRLNAKSLAKMRVSPEEELNDVASKFANALKTAGVKVKRADGEYLWNWMVKWFNPNPSIGNGDSSELIRIASYPGDDKMPFGIDFSEGLVFRRPSSDAETGTWWFDDLPHLCTSIQGLKGRPEIGHISAERQMGEFTTSLLDLLPENSIWSMTVTISVQDDVKDHLTKIKRASVGDSADAEFARDEAEYATRQISKNNYLYKTCMNVYVRAKDIKELRRQNIQTNSLLAANKLQPIDELDDELALDTYIRQLPMNYEPEKDKKRYKSRFAFTKDLANLLPVYGRSRGTGHPGIFFFNRGAEPVMMDPLNKHDRRKNGHMLIFGPTGAGKSAQLVWLIMHYMAVIRPRIFLIEAGGSFRLLGDFFKDRGLSVNQVTLNPKSGVSIPPFAQAVQLLDDVELDLEEKLDHDRDYDYENVDDVDEEDEQEEDKRDLLGEMEIAARIMITGGEEKEDERMTRADRLVIRKAILKAAEITRGEGRSQTMVSDVARAMRELEFETESRKERAIEMADGLELFCNGLGGEFFNKEGESWPEVDVTIMEMGVTAREGNEDLLNVAYIGLMNTINNIVERTQYEHRPTIVITDEGHLITTNPLLAPYIVKITKMWRKLGAWKWIATQNLEDFPDKSRRMLNMMEWWCCLVMPKDEVTHIARFKSLTPEQESLLLAAKKEPGKYTEGVMLSDTQAALFRSVPTSKALALAMSEKEEKVERKEIMVQEKCTELEAAMIVAKRLDELRGLS